MIRKILEILKCQICMETLWGDNCHVRQCVRGHLLCEECAKKVTACPTCRNTIAVFRNLAIEQVGEVILVSCRYESSGCGQLLSKSKISAHLTECPFRLFVCSISGCKWSGSKFEFEVHYREKHPRLVLDPRGEVVRVQRNLRLERWSFLKDEIFKVTFGFDKNQNVLLGSVRQYCSLKYSERYKFTMSLKAEKMELSCTKRVGPELSERDRPVICFPLGNLKDDNDGEDKCPNKLFEIRVSIQDSQSSTMATTGSVGVDQVKNHSIPDRDAGIPEHTSIGDGNLKDKFLVAVYERCHLWSWDERLPGKGRDFQEAIVNLSKAVRKCMEDLVHIMKGETDLVLVRTLAELWNTSGVLCREELRQMEKHLNKNCAEQENDIGLWRAVAWLVATKVDTWSTSTAWYQFRDKDFGFLDEKAWGDWKSKKCATGFSRLVKSLDRPGEQKKALELITSWVQPELAN